VLGVSSSDARPSKSYDADVDYDLSRLGDREFEHLAQALAVHYLGPNVSVFGAGPDGGREAVWKGSIDGHTLGSGQWTGYGVIQAKYKFRDEGHKKNAQWLISTVKAELNEWTKPDTKRKPAPEYYVVVTNVLLTPTAEVGGIDTVDEALVDCAKALQLNIKKFAIWHYDQIRALLDDAVDIRTTYAAWITPGDVLAQLIADRVERIADIQGVLRSHLAKSLIDETRLNLTQAGSVSDKPIGIADAFVDLPATAPSRADVEYRLDAEEADEEEVDEEEVDADDVEIFDDPNGRVKIEGISAQIILAANKKLDPDSIKDDRVASRASRLVLVGGPGQGKSTIGQFLCQIYRASLLHGTNLDAMPELADAIGNIRSHCLRIGLAAPAARRWPYAIRLTDFADALAKKQHGTVLDYIAAEITARAGVEISVLDLRHWLARYPWLVIFDGLDEVPASSNREQVLRSVRDFFLDAASVSADLLVLTTTRPQGYTDEFDPVHYRHYHLSDLTTQVALAYAQRLLTLRLGDQTSRVKEVFGRVQRAAREEATSRLMTSPLQVTILALLVERLGRAPKDRWKLFSQYYRVIYQREQEKGGPLADILHEYETHINAIHRDIGFWLQARGELAGDTTSSLSLDRLHKFIYDRMIKEGFSQSDASAQARRFIEVFTDRLVFITELRQGVFGFEIRSLQEFMAGEAVVDQLESGDSSTFDAIAMSGYWRNTILFAIGRIFGDREYLRGSVVSLCAELNVRNMAARLATAGSDLALSALSEGVPRTVPAFAKPLAACACQALNAGSATVGRLAELDGLGLRPELDAELQVAMRGTRVAQISAAVVLCQLGSLGDSKAIEWLKRFIDNADEKVLTELLWLAFSNGLTPIVSLMSGRVLGESPIVAMLRYHGDEGDTWQIRAASGSPTEAVETAEWPVPVWLANLRSLQMRAHTGDRRVRAELPITGNIGLSFTSVDGVRDAWSMVAKIPARSGPWRAVKAVASYMIKPNARTLAIALRQCARHINESLMLTTTTSWPLEASVIAAFSNIDGALLTGGGDDTSYVSARLRELAVAAEAGELGDLADWEEAESRWRSGISVEDLLTAGPVSEASTFSGNLPIWRGLGQRGVVLNSTSFSGRPQVYMSQTWEELVDIYRRMPRAARPQFSEQIFLIAHFAERTSTTARRHQSSRVVKNTVFNYPLSNVDLDIALDAVQSTCISGPWIGVISLDIFRPTALKIHPVRSLLMQLGRLPRIASYGENLLQEISKAWRDDDKAWPLARLALHRFSRPSLRLDEYPMQDENVYQVSDPVERRFRVFARCVQLIEAGRLTADEARAVVNLLKEPIVRAPGGPHWRRMDSVNLELLRAYLTFSQPESADGWAEIVRATMDVDFDLGRGMVLDLGNLLRSAKALSVRPDLS